MSLAQPSSGCSVVYLEAKSTPRFAPGRFREYTPCATAAVEARIPGSVEKECPLEVKTEFLGAALGARDVSALLTGEAV